MDQLDKIIDHYLSNYMRITKEDMTCMINQCCYVNDHQETLSCSRFKVINNKLYQCPVIQYSGWETRTEAFKYMMLQTLKEHTIPDCEFVVYTDDGINERTIHKMTRNGNLLPVLVTTSVIYKYNAILCPDFTFSFASEYAIMNNTKMSTSIIESVRDVPFESKQNKMVWRGGLSPYRAKHFRSDDKYDIRNVVSSTRFRGDVTNLFQAPNSLTRKEKAQYKYHLHLNGHNGNEINGAYSSALKWSLMSNSLVFYSAPVFYREFWLHPLICRENEHFIYVKDMAELDMVYNYYILRPEMAKQIAQNAYEFSKVYFQDYGVITYYMQRLLSEYSKRLDYEVVLDKDDILIEKIMYNAYLAEEYGLTP